MARILITFVREGMDQPDPAEAPKADYDEDQELVMVSFQQKRAGDLVQGDRVRVLGVARTVDTVQMV
jgi:hypothetical protein